MTPQEHNKRVIEEIECLIRKEAPEMIMQVAEEKGALFGKLSEDEIPLYFINPLTTFLLQKLKERDFIYEEKKNL